MAFIDDAPVGAEFPPPADDFLEGPSDIQRRPASKPPATFASDLSGRPMVEFGLHVRDLAAAL